MAICSLILLPRPLRLFVRTLNFWAAPWVARSALPNEEVYSMLNFKRDVGTDGVDDYCHFLLPCPELGRFGPSTQVPHLPLPTLASSTKSW